MAGLLVAVFWAILVSFLAVALVRLAQALSAATRMLNAVTDRAVPLLGEASAAVRSAQTQLDRVDTIASDVEDVAASASALSATVATTFGGPLVKVAAFGYGVRRALARRDSRDAAASPGTARTVPGRALPVPRRRRAGRQGKD